MDVQCQPRKNIGVAVIKNSAGLILIDRRRSQGSFGGFWEFPGGKVESDETVEECIKREIKEEIGIEISVESHLMTIDHTYSQFNVRLQVYNCQYVSGEPQPLECEEILWVAVDDLHNYNFPSANLQIISALRLTL
ncbi:MAG: 8-oxo-dGTP diphosphatase [Chroococcopsis gigantea SAG 12.99]|jgi:8-oxo-dGTP diphosphatase|nr:8-oxo-dGTP diphosphatase MutT [Chlorogloea purpurea SAG 13.99]MDV2999237.1 8-oxo-dGTP diphosphatase [Chroococcopsis gigantea SAG 12.99]